MLMDFPTYCIIRRFKVVVNHDTKIFMILYSLDWLLMMPGKRWRFFLKAIIISFYISKVLRWALLASPFLDNTLINSEIPSCTKCYVLSETSDISFAAQISFYFHSYKHLSYFMKFSSSSKQSDFDNSKSTVQKSL